MRETPISGTCNNNGAFSTKVTMNARYVGFLMRENGGVWTLAGKSPNGSTGQPFTASWSSGSHKSNMSLCAASFIGSSVGTVTCGYGTHYSTATIKNGQDIHPVLVSLSKKNHFLNYGF